MRPGGVASHQASKVMAHRSEGVQDIVAKRSTKARARKKIDKKVDETVEPIAWHSAAGLVGQLQPELGLTLALTEITTAARTGQLRTQVRAARRDTVLCTDLTAEVWQVLRLVAVMDIPLGERGFPQHHKSSWTRQVRLEWIHRRDGFQPEEPPVPHAPFQAGLEWILEGGRLFVCEADCQKLWPTNEKPPLKETTPANRHGGGRKEGFDWDAILVEAVLRWHALGCPDPEDFSLSQLAQDLYEWCGAHLAGGEAPAPDTISRRLSKALTAWKLSSAK
jgi:hypothetical protein